MMNEANDTSRRMKLWSLQRRTFADGLCRSSIFSDWKLTPQNWRGYYRWMATQWNARIQSEKLAVPIWCWHSCNGIDGSCPTVGTLAMLMGDWDYHARDMTVLELNVPANLVLLSSYFRWNEAIEHAIDRQTDSIERDAFLDMFDTPLFKHGTDDIQAVIPRIERTWVTRRWSLPSGDANELDWDMPCSAFPETPEPASADESPS